LPIKRNKFRQPIERLFSVIVFLLIYLNEVLRGYRLVIGVMSSEVKSYEAR